MRWCLASGARASHHRTQHITECTGTHHHHHRHHHRRRVVRPHHRRINRSPGETALPESLFVVTSDTSHTAASPAAVVVVPIPLNDHHHRSNLFNESALRTHTLTIFRTIIVLLCECAGREQIDCLAAANCPKRVSCWRDRLMMHLTSVCQMCFFLFWCVCCDCFHLLLLLLSPSSLSACFCHLACSLALLSAR